MISKPTNYAMVNYLEDFSCLGDKCPDTCCKGWTIGYDEVSYKTLKSKLKTAEEQKELKAKIKINKQGGDSNYFAILKHRPDGACSYLDEENLCSIQRRYGSGCLSNICSDFPRETSYIGKTVEVAASFACPEIIRLSLLSDKIELHSVESKQTKIREHAVIKQFINDPADTSAFILFRQSMLGIINGVDMDFNAKLFVMAFAAHKLSSASDINAVFKEVKDNYTSSGGLNEFAAIFFEDDSGNEFGFSLIASILLSREGAGRTPIGDLFEAIILPHAIEIETDSVTINMADLLQNYVRTKGHLFSTCNTLVNKQFSNYIGNHLVSEYCRMPKFYYEYIYKLAIKVSLIKFLVFIQLSTRTRDDMSVSEIEQILTETMTDVITKVTRVLGHMKEFFDKSYKNLAEHDQTGLAHLAALMKF